MRARILQPLRPFGPRGCRADWATTPRATGERQRPTSDRFYDRIEPVEDFEDLATTSSYLPLPDDWHIVAADVTGSTQAIGEGRYKEVNTVGVSVIAAVRNAVRPLEVPYVFGGDGAVLCVPGRCAPEVRSALAATVAMAETAFDLRLRAGIGPVGFVRGRGLDVLVARHRVSEHYLQCALFGGGADYFERALKTGDLPASFVVEADPEGAADYGGLECRWNEIPSPAAETVALIVSSTAATPASLDLYRWVMRRTREIYGEAEACRPVVEKGLRVALSGRTLSNESRLQGWRLDWVDRLRHAARLRLHTLIGWFLIRFGIRTESTDWGAYRRDLVANTDFRKFDGALRLVLAGSADQRAQLTAFLDNLRDAGSIAYGMHVSDSALMTCLIEKREGAHFHFVDAAGGGYAAAAHAMKAATAAESPAARARPG